jgi:hypothetical protein
MKLPWKTIVWTAVILGIPTSFFVDKHPWVIAIPIVIGTAIVTIQALRTEKPTK